MRTPTTSHATSACDQCMRQCSQRALRRSSAPPPSPFPPTQGHESPVIALAFDPQNEYIASADVDGTVKLWDMKTMKMVIAKEGLAPPTDVDNLNRFSIAWQPPHGSLLAVPNTEGEVAMCDRDCGDVLLTLQVSSPSPSPSLNHTHNRNHNQRLLHHRYLQPL